MHQPWRTFAAIINRCISGKSTSLDRPWPSRAQILWGFYKENVDIVALLWEDFMFQADNRDISHAQEPAKKPKRAKHPEAAKKSTPAKKDKKALEKAKRSKGIELLSDAALLEEAQLKKALKISKRDTNIHQASGSSEEANSKLDVPNEPKGKSIYTSEGIGLKPGVPDVSTTDSSEIENESWGDSGDEANEQRDDKADEQKETQDDEYVHTPEDYVPTNDDESDDVTEDEYERINEELYGDVNLSLTDAEPADKKKDDEEMTVAGHVNVNHKGADINVQHEVPRTSPLLTIPVSVILEHTVVNPPEIVTTASSTTISSLLSSLFPHLQQLTSIPTPSTTEATTSTTTVPDSETLSTFHQRITNLEKDVKELKTVDHSTTLLSTIKSEVPNAIKEYLGTSLDDALCKVLKKHDVDIIKEHSVPAKIIERLRQKYVPEKSTEDIRKIKMEHARKKQEPKETITSSDTSAQEEFDQKTTLFQTMTNSNSFSRSPKQRALYHALMESILEDEDAMDEGVADKLKKRKPDDADKDEGPSTGSDRALKRRKTSKDTKLSKKAKSTETSKGTSKSQPKSIDKSAQAEETEFEAGDTQGPHNQRQDMGDTDDQPNVKAALKHEWFKKPKKPPTPNSNWNIDNLTQEHLVGPTFNLLKGTCESHVELEYNIKECYKAITDRLDWNNPEGKEYPFDLSKPLPLIMERGR
ncbi:hypothetical protein Tco_0957443 [Tanacetum coccineum]